MEQLEKALAVVDTEWSDGSPATARLVSIAIARHEPDGTKTSVFWVVNPGMPISAESTAIHGIRDADVTDEPGFEKIAPEVAKLLTDCDIAGYGVQGDIQLIEREMEIARVEWSPEGAAIVDGHRMWQVLEPRKLQDAYEKFVGPMPENGRTHHAGFDVDLTSAVIDALRDNRPIQEIHEETNRHMVDVAGKFRLDQGKRIVLAFGPYRGAVAANHPAYLSWMLSKDFPRSTRLVARRLLEEQDQAHCSAEGEHESAPEAAEVGENEPPF